MKDQHEFFPAAEIPWTTADQGIRQRVLSTAEDGTLTRIAHWPAGTISGSEVIKHEYFEEVYLLEGSLTDTTLGKTFKPGDYAARRPGMPHGPYRTDEGCTMLEIRYNVS